MRTRRQKSKSQEQDDELLLISSVNYILRYGGKEFLKLIVRIKNGTLAEKVHQFRLNLDLQETEFDAPVNEKGETLIDQTLSVDPGPDELLIEKDRERVLEPLLGALTPFAKEVIYRRYGFHGYEPQTRDEIAALKKVRSEHVRHVEAKTLRALQRQFELRGFDRTSV